MKAQHTKEKETTKSPSFEIFGRCYGPTMSTAEAAELFGCSEERLQQQRGKGTLPVEPLQLGRRLRWPTLLVAQALGVDLDERTLRLIGERRAEPPAIRTASRPRPTIQCRHDRGAA